jgi:opacity protein-like surface antigen
MKKTLAAATLAALVGVAGAANAADLYKGGSMKDAPVYVPPPTWTGFYIGAHVGGFWADIKNHDINDYMGHGVADWGWNNNNDGVFGGGTVGYNYQTGALVFGVEADFGGAGLTGNWNDGLAANSPFFLHAKNDGSFYADVTGRLGYAAGPALFYVKGGWAFLDANLRVDGWNANANGGLGAPWSVSRNGLDGWTAGGGIEYMWTPSWSVKAEYLFFDFGKNDVNWFGYGQNWGFDRDLQVNSFKVGLNYHFANVYTPLK